jgi:hypothetical protein
MQCSVRSEGGRTLSPVAQRKACDRQIHWGASTGAWLVIGSYSWLVRIVTVGETGSCAVIGSSNDLDLYVTSLSGYIIKAELFKQPKCPLPCTTSRIEILVL